MKTYLKTLIIVISLIGIFLVFNGADCDNAVQYIIGNKNPSELTRDDVTQAVSNIANIMAGVAGSVTIIMMIYGGIQYITSAGNQEAAGRAKGTLTWAVIGFILILSSWGLLKFFLNRILGI